MNRQQLAQQIAETHIGYLTHLPDLLCIEEFKSDYDRLLQQIRQERAAELREASNTIHPEILQEFAAEAGFLLGLAIGQTLSKCQDDLR